MLARHSLADKGALQQLAVAVRFSSTAQELQGILAEILTRLTFLLQTLTAIEPGQQSSREERLDTLRAMTLAQQTQRLVQWLQAAPPLPLVQFAVGAPRVVEPELFQCVRGHESVSAVQLPLKVGFACTIHASQGLSTDRVDTNLDGVFEAGQAYVALSRCRTLAGLQLFGQRKSIGRRIFAHSAALHATERFARIDRGEQTLLTREQRLRMCRSRLRAERLKRQRTVVRVGDEKRKK